MPLKLTGTFPFISVDTDATPKQEVIQLFAVDEIRSLVQREETENAKTEITNKSEINLMCEAL